MLSVRSAILLAVLLLAISLLASIISMLSPPDSNGLGRDSYGTHSDGYKALYTLLEELNIGVRREFTPPVPGAPGQTLALLGPDDMLVAVEPNYLKQLLPWIDQGGRLVVAVGQQDAFKKKLRQLRKMAQKTPLPTLFEILHLPEIEVAAYSSLPDEASPRIDPEDDEALARAIVDELDASVVPAQVIPVHLTGDFATLITTVDELALPGDHYGILELNDASASGEIATVDSEGERHVLAAEFKRGQGAIVLLAAPELLSNRLLAKADNSILSVHLLSPVGEPVIFDEFFHGLGVRGNSLYLLTRPGYAALALGLLTFTCLASWRSARLLGPSLPDQEQSRRDIGEYISAMANFYCQGRRARPYLVRQLQAGVLRELNQSLGLPPDNQQLERVTGSLTLRNPQRAAQIETTFRETDQALSSRKKWSESQTLDAMRRLTACL